jgi:hypothetical protein
MAEDEIQRYSCHVILDVLLLSTLGRRQASTQDLERDGNQRFHMIEWLIEIPNSNTSRFGYQISVTFNKFPATLSLT